jgi:hypothetical protein
LLLGSGFKDGQGKGNQRGNAGKTNGKTDQADSP